MLSAKRQTKLAASYPLYSLLAPELAVESTSRASPIVLLQKRPYVNQSCMDHLHSMEKWYK